MTDNASSIKETRGWYADYVFGNPDRFAWVPGRAGAKEDEMVGGEESAWDYGVRHVDVDGWTRVDPHESRSDADADFSTCGMNCSVVRRRKAGPWVEVADA